MRINHDGIGIRLGQILKIFLSGEHISTIELAKEFGVNIRTIQRDLHDRLGYLPLKRDINQCYYLQEEALGKIGFKDIRDFAKLSGIADLYPNLSDEFISEILFARIKSTLNTNNQQHKDSPIIVKNQGFSNSALYYKHFKTLSIAILKNKHTNFTYKDKKRNVKPYRMLNNNGVWYLLAVEDETLKHFTLNLIKDVYVKKERFKIDLEVEKLINEEQIVWASQNIQEAKLMIDNSSQEYFFRKAFVSEPKIIEQNKDYFLVSCKYSYDDELLNVVKMFLPHIKIISPDNLKNKLYVMLQDYIDKCNK